MSKFKSIKTFDGFSTCFRQWRAEGTHCKYLHSYSISFKVEFEGDLDEKNWVMDFGIGSRSKNKIEGKTLKEYLNYMFDHTTLIAEDDPYLHTFEDLDKYGLIQLRVLPNVGCERFAEFIYNKMEKFINLETDGRVHITKVEFFENEKNSAIYTEG